MKKLNQCPYNIHQLCLRINYKNQFLLLKTFFTNGINNSLENQYVCKRKQQPQDFKLTHVGFPFDAFFSTVFNILILATSFTATLQHTWKLFSCFPLFHGFRILLGYVHIKDDQPVFFISQPTKLCFSIDKFCMTKKQQPEIHF